MHGDEVMVLLIMMSFVALIFGIVYIRNRENMALIERGINPRAQQRSLPKPFGSLKYGLLIMGVGAGLLIAMLLDVNMNLSTKEILPSGSVHYNHHDEVYPALMALGGGLGLVISYFIEKSYLEKLKDRNED